MVFARALYDNQAETPDELSFRVNDLIHVIEKNTDDMEGWWKCRLGDSEGLCPANYLELVQSSTPPDEVYDIPRKILTSSEDTYDILPKRNFSTNSDYDVLPGRERVESQESYDELPAARLRNPHKLKKQKHFDEQDGPPKVPAQISDEVYDELPKRNFSGTSDYDELPSNNNNNRVEHDSDYDELKPKNFRRQESVYDVPRRSMPPRPSVSIEEDYDIPRSTVDLSRVGDPDLTRVGSQGLPTLPAKQNSLNDDYDKLPSKATPPRLTYKTLTSSDIGSSNGALSALSHSSRNSITSNSSSDSSCLYLLKTDVQPLLIDTEQAMESLVSLKKLVDSSIADLLNFLSTDWRSDGQLIQIDSNRNNFEQKTRLMTKSIGDFVDFSQSALATAAQSGRKKMVSHITRKLQPIEEDYKILTEMEEKMTQNNWDIKCLVDSSGDRRVGVPDDLDSFVMTSRATPDDVAAVASYLYTHSQNIFRRKGSSISSSQLSIHNRSFSSNQVSDVDRRSLPLPTVPSQSRVPVEEEIDHDQDDYDYIQLDELPPMANKKMTIKSPHYNRMSSFKEIPGNEQTDPMKERLISFYYQFGLSQGVLQEDIDSFFNSAKSQPPKSFVILSKRILKRVNELVFLGDATSKVFESNGQKETVSKLSDLSNRLASHTATTAEQVDRAAKVWPSPNELQTAVNLTAAISEHVRSLKHSIHNAISAA